jgi:NADH-quinone oxidoreductase subunit M
VIALAAIVTPLVAAALCAVPRIGRIVAALAALVVVVLALYAFDARPAGMRLLWAAPLGSSFSLGFDPASSIVAAASAAIVLAAVTSAGAVGDRRAFFALQCLALASAVTVFTARDLAAFFIGWEGLVLVLAVLVRHWGVAERGAASARLALHALAGSAVFLVALASIGAARGTLDIDALAARPIAAAGQTLPALLFLAAFAPALSLFPLHVGTTRAHSAVTPAVGALLVGPLALSAAHGIVRICIGLFPQGMAAAAPVLVGVAAVGALYAALVAWRQDDTRRAIAFAAMAQQEVAALALFAATPESIRGAIVLLVANALAAVAALTASGAIARRVASFHLSRAGGLRSSAPRLATLTTLAMLALIGVPGSGVFAGDVLSLVGANERYPAAVAAAAFVVAVVAASAAVFMRRALDGPPLVVASRDVGRREGAVVVALLTLVLVLGVAPRAITDRISDDSLPASEITP